jgi:hypothetical protein
MKRKGRDEPGPSSFGFIAAAIIRLTYPIPPACRGSRMGSADDIPRSLHRPPRSDRSPIGEGQLAQDLPLLST